MFNIFFSCFSTNICHYRIKHLKMTSVKKEGKITLSRNVEKNVCEKNCWKSAAVLILGLKVVCIIIWYTFYVSRRCTVSSVPKTENDLPLHDFKNNYNNVCMNINSTWTLYLRTLELIMLLFWPNRGIIRGCYFCLLC